MKEVISSITGETIVKITAVGGGCINKTYRLTTKGSDFFMKCNDSERYPQMFELEAKGLALLKDTGQIKVPQVLHVGAVKGVAFLLMEFIESSRGSSRFWKRLGECLANIHRCTQELFGLTYDNYIGSLVQKNQLEQDWHYFFIQHRIKEQLAIYKRISDSSGLENRFGQLFELLPGLLPPSEKPSLLHGDLWSGNFMVTKNEEPVLIDPAVYYGNREMDLALSRLFGGFDRKFYESYQSNFPLEPGFEERVDIYNLYPLMVHVNLFGGGYIHQVNSILDRYLV